MANFKRALFSIHRILNYTATHGRIIAPRSPIPPESLLRPCVGSFSRLYSPNQSLDIDLSNEESKRRLFNRLLYRSRQRGFLELDLVLGKWVEEHVYSLDENGIKSLVHVLDQGWHVMQGVDLRFTWLVMFCLVIFHMQENPDLWKWLTEQEQPPEAINMNPVFHAVREKVMSNLNSHAAPETRATAGQQWVRGWDDFKKGQDGPISENQ